MFQIIDDYIDFLKIEKGLSQNTIISYTNDLKKFAKFLIKNKIKEFKEIKRETIIKFTIDRSKKNENYNTIAREIVTIKGFLKYLYNEGIIKKDIYSLIESPKIWNIIPDVLSPQEINSILQTSMQAKKNKYRNTAIIELLYSCGLRVSELCSLNIEDIKTEYDFIKCKGKGGKERLIPIGSKAKNAILQYIKFERPQTNTKALFISKNKKRISRQSIWKIIKQTTLKAKINKNIYPHIFRHSFATHLLSGGADIRTVQELLGHSDITTTQIYTHIDKTKLKSIHQKFHPINQIM